MQETPEVKAATERCQWLLLPGVNDWENTSVAAIRDMGLLAAEYLRLRSASGVVSPALQNLLQECDMIGSWLSAALEDKDSCDKFKADIHRFLDATNAVVKGGVTPKPSGVVVEREWSTCGAKQPEPHKRYAVLRDGFVFTATPCYGMHNPWWVGRTLGDRLTGWYETDPADMRDDDKWIEIGDLRALLARETPGGG